MKLLTTILLSAVATTQAATIHNPSRSVSASGAGVTTDTSATTDVGLKTLGVEIGREFDYYPIDQRGGFATSGYQYSTITPNGVDFTGQTAGSYHAHLVDVYGYSLVLLNVDFELLVPTSYTLTMTYAASYGYGAGIVRWDDVVATGTFDTGGTQTLNGVLQPGTYHLMTGLNHIGQADGRYGPPAFNSSSEQLQLNLVLTSVVPTQVPDAGSWSMVLPMGLLLLCGRRK